VYTKCEGTIAANSCVFQKQLVNETEVDMVLKRSESGWEQCILLCWYVVAEGQRQF